MKTLKKILLVLISLIVVVAGFIFCFEIQSEARYFDRERKPVTEESLDKKAREFC